MSAARLYTPELLATALELAQWPPLPAARRHAEVRAPVCGSTLALDLDLDDQGRIVAIGMRVSACAVGQAAAVVFARHAQGREAQGLERDHAALLRWLGDADAPLPSWPDLALIAPARAYPGRHGAILLPWQGALAALSSARGAS